MRPNPIAPILSTALAASAACCAIAFAQDKDPHATAADPHAAKADPHAEAHAADPHASDPHAGAHGHGGAPTAEEVDAAKMESRLLTEIRQLTFAGRRAGEGYFSADGTKMVFQSEREPENPFFQIYLLDFETGDTERISPGSGKTTCAWIHPSNKKVLFASTHADAEAVAKQEAELADRKEGRVKKYSWDYDENFDIWEKDLATGEMRNLTHAKGYDAEGSYSPDGQWIAFASNRHAYTTELGKEDAERFAIDKSYLMDIYLMRADGTELRRLTEAKGYDGGPFFSPDGKKICWRRFTPDGHQAEVYTMNADGTGERQITKLGAMSWAPYFHPSGEYLIFATNLHGFANFELYLADAEAQMEPVRVTWTDGFDGLPAFSPDGKSLAWTTNRTPDKKSQIFMAKWDHEAAMLALAGSKSEAHDHPDIATAAQPETSEAVAAADIKKHVEVLASKEFAGRLTGTEGEAKATQYVADAFKALGLQAAGDGGTYFQPFEFTAGVDLGEHNALRLAGGGDFKVGEDWQPLGFSTLGKVEPSGIVFAGYGIEVPEGQGAETYSSYAHLDVKDKWVLMFRYLPEGITPEQRQDFARFSSLRYKAMVARQRGARGILVASGPNSQVKNQLVPLRYDASMADSGVAALSISDAVAQRLLDAAEKDLKSLQDKLDTGEMMGGIALGDLKLGAEIEILQERRTGRNVLARLPSGNASAPAVIIGAHVDHLGPKAGASSRAKGDETDQIHYGADDNASGVAGLLEIAQLLAAQQKAGKLPLKRDIVFAAWSGEEIGLLGSSHFVQSVAKAAGDADGPIRSRYSAYLNMDMIGRLEDKLVLQGAGSSNYWAAEIERRNAVLGLPVSAQDESFASTDSTSFYVRGVPILNAFTGAHEDYHTPRDTPDKLNYEGAERIAKFMGLVARGLATSSEVPDYIEAKREEEMGARAGLRAYLGTIPDYSQGDVEGVKLSGVAKGGPADQAGIKGGDIIVKLAGKDLKNIYDYTYAIEAVKIGEEIEIEVTRKGERLKMKITPGSRE